MKGFETGPGGDFRPVTAAIGALSSRLTGDWRSIRELYRKVAAGGTDVALACELLRSAPRLDVGTAAAHERLLCAVRAGQKMDYWTDRTIEDEVAVCCFDATSIRVTARERLKMVRKRSFSVPAERVTDLVDSALVRFFLDKGLRASVAFYPLAYPGPDGRRRTSWIAELRVSPVSGG